MATRSQAFRRILHERLDVSHGPRRHEVEWRRRRQPKIILQPLAANLNSVKSASPGHLLQEGPLFRYRLKKGDGEFRLRDLKRQAWEPGAAADIEQPSAEGDPLGEVEALAEMAGDALFGASDGREVYSPIPAQQQVEVDEYCPGFLRRERDSKRGKDLAEAGLIEHRAILGAPSSPCKGPTHDKPEALGNRPACDLPRCFTWNILVQRIENKPVITTMA